MPELYPALEGRAFGLERQHGQALGCRHESAAADVQGLFVRGQLGSILAGLQAGYVGWIHLLLCAL